MLTEKIARFFSINLKETVDWSKSTVTIDFGADGKLYMRVNRHLGMLLAYESEDASGELHAIANSVHGANLDAKQIVNALVLSMREVSWV